MEDSLLDSVMEDSINGGYGSILDSLDYDLREDDDDIEDDEYDDGDYPGVEQDENMSRIEGDDFWAGGE